jgi:hypothetical protein
MILSCLASANQPGPADEFNDDAALGCDQGFVVALASFGNKRRFVQ